MIDFKGYGLSENPFPETAVIDLSSTDLRNNGGIFHEAIFSGEIEAMRKKTLQGVNVVYISGNQSDRGLGKSALMIYHMRTLRGSPNSTCTYVRCLQRDKPADIARKIVSEWHGSGVLWGVFRKAFMEFTVERKDPLLAPDAVKALFDANMEMPESLPLSLYTHVRDTDRLASAFGSWASTKLRLDEACLTRIACDYLSQPLMFKDSILGRKVNPILLYEACLKFMNGYGYKRHYVFLDQFEDSVEGTSKSKIGGYALDMKSIIRASSGLASIFLTLHQNSEQSLRSPNAKDLTSVAPMDTVHRIDIMASGVGPENAVSLAEAYFSCFRVGDAPYPTFPVAPELVELVWFLNKGVIRDFLQKLHHAINHGALNDVPELTLEYALEHPLETLGREVSGKVLEEFNRWRGRPALTSPTGRSWEFVLRDFKRKEL